MWHSVFTACDLFRTLAKDVAQSCGYTYAVADDTNMTVYLRRVESITAAGRAYKC